MNQPNYYDTGRDMSPAETLRQIGFMNLAAISGGRWVPLGPSAIGLPVGSGYRVVVILAADDTYTVRREFVRKGRVFDHGEVVGVHFDGLGEIAYQASCFRTTRLFGQEVAPS